MEIEAQMAADRERAAKLATQEEEKEKLKRRQEVVVGNATVGMRSVVRRPASGTATKTGGNVVKKPPTRRAGRGF